MNNLMTKSFMSYVDLKKQALKDLEAESSLDLEAGQITHAEEENLSQFFEEVRAIQSEMEDISSLLLDLQSLNEETKSVHSAKVLRGLRDRMDSDMVSILRKAKIIKVGLEALDRSNTANRCISACFREGSPVDRTRFSVNNGLRRRLKEMMNEFQSLRERILAEHKEELKRRFFTCTGEVATEDVIDKMLSGGGQVELLGNRGEVVLDMLERQKAVSDIQRSLMQLHQVFLDMAAMVEVQGEQLNDIEENVVHAKVYISGGTDRLAAANALRKRNRKCAYWFWALVVIVALVCLIPIFISS